MAFETFRNYCPGCGEQIKPSKNADGRFACPKCGCEYVRNWRRYIYCGGPLFLWLGGMGVFAAIKRFPPQGLVIWGGIVCGVLLFIFPDEYTVVKPGRDQEEAGDERDTVR